MRREERWERGVRLTALCALLFLLFSLLLPLQAYGRLRGQILRFHVVAASDSAHDQEVKLALRDRLLAECASGLSACRDLSEAAQYLQENRAHLEQTARAFLREKGEGGTVTVALLSEEHRAKAYGDVTLPAGEYLSLRVTIGAGEGKNFFCVLFPPLCLGGAQQQASEVLFDYGFSEGGVRLLQSDAERTPRLFLVRLFARLFEL